MKTLRWRKTGFKFRAICTFKTHFREQISAEMLFQCVEITCDKSLQTLIMSVHVLSKQFSKPNNTIISLYGSCQCEYQHYCETVYLLPFKLDFSRFRGYKKISGCSKLTCRNPDICSCFHASIGPKTNTIFSDFSACQSPTYLANQFRFSEGVAS